MHDWAREVRSRLAKVQLSPTREADIVDELSQHLQDRYDQLLGDGATPEEAERMALAEFQSHTALADRLAALRQAQASTPFTLAAPSGAFVTDLWLDVRSALRLVAKEPVLSATVVFALATGVCLATVGFTLREAVLHGSLPFDPDGRFVRLVLHSDADDNVEVDLDGYHAIRDTSTSFLHVGAVGSAEYALENGDGTVEPIRVGLITPRSFAPLPAVPMIGRVLTARDGETGAEPVVVVRESLWRRRFGANTSVLGQQIQLSGIRRTVVGVLPDSFQFPADGEVWVPLDEATLAGRANPSGASLTVFGILRDGLEVDRATAELSAYSRAEQPNRPGSATTVRALPFTGDDETTDMVMSGLVAVLVLVLLVVASNIASLVFARTWARAPELAVRTAIGAARARIVRQLFVEVGVLCAGASLVGLGLAHVALRYLTDMLADMPFWMTFDPTVRTMAFVVGLTCVISIVSGLMPVLKVTNANLLAALHAQGRGVARGSLGSIGRVLVIEVALSVALLNGALVVARAFASFVDDIPGLPNGQVLTARLAGELSSDARDRVLAEVRALPGVVSAGAGSHLPRLDPMQVPILVESSGGEAEDLVVSAPMTAVTDGFLESIGGRPIAGRVFEPRDYRAGAAPAVVVNRAFVERVLGGRSPLGRRVKLLSSASGGESPWHELIGVVPDLGMSAGDRANAAGIYTALPARSSSLFVVIRSASDPNTSAGALRRIVAQADSAVEVRNIRLVEAAGQEQRSFLTGMALTMTALGGMALLMAVVSIYALLSLMVTQRTREIGVRVALGARRSQVLVTVVGHAAALLGGGAAVGTVLGVMLAGFQSVMLIRMPAVGWVTPAAVVLAVVFASAAAAWLPTRRALAIRPAEALGIE